MAQFRLDLSKVKLGGAVRAVLKPVAAADRVATKVERGMYRAGDKASHPLVTKRLGRCTVACVAEITAVADLPAINPAEYVGIEVCLLRLRVRRPDGEAEACVRQTVPAPFRRATVPGATVVALTHESERETAIVDWPATAQQLGLPPHPVGSHAQFALPDRAEWPAEGAIEVRDNDKHERRLAERRRDWSRATAHLHDASPTSKNDDWRMVWKLALELSDGSSAEIDERVPELAAARLAEARKGDQKLGGLVTTVRRVARAGAPIQGLVEPGGDGIAVDWEATINSPELREAGPIES